LRDTCALPTAREHLGNFGCDPRAEACRCNDLDPRAKAQYNKARIGLIVEVHAKLDPAMIAAMTIRPIWSHSTPSLDDSGGRWFEAQGRRILAALFELL
jgi:hypothetical protein